MFSVLRPKNICMTMLGVAVALAALGTVAISASGAATTRLPVVRCPTTFGIGGSHPRVPASVTVGRALSAGLVAYTNTELFLIAPRGLRCSGTVAADGGTQVIAWAAGHPKPGLHSPGVGFTLTVDPACAGCRADDACPFFTAFAKELGFPCGAGVPAGEHVVRPSAALALFEDPPGVRGSGWPSGGRYPANGVVGLFGKGADAAVYRATCTLPVADHAVCTQSLDETISHYR
jgi:hypothetical protein